MDGSTFLALYSVLFLMAIAGAWFVRRQLRVPDDDVRDGELHPYEHAYLQGGEARAVASSIAALQERGTVIVNGDRDPAIVAVANRDEALAHPLDRAVVRTLDTPTPQSFDRGLASRLRALPELATIRERLERRALLLDANAARPARLAPAAVMLAFAGIGVARMIHGVEATKPVGVTMLMVIVGIAVAAYFASRRVICSVRGTLVLARHSGAFREQRAPNAGTARDARVARVARLVAIDGPSAVPALAAALAVLALGTGFTADRDSGAGGGGGGDGGGCGGGGCGGCGG